MTINKISLAQDGGTFTKTYDRTTDIPNIGTISGIVSADESYLTIGGSFSDKNAGNNKTVTFTLTAETNYEYLLDNYILPASVTGIINPKPITLTYTDVDSDSDIDDDDKYLTWTKTYDGTANISVNVNTMISGIIAGDTVTVTARYNSKNVLAANSIVFTKTGADSANYTISNVDFSTYMSTNSVKLITPYSLADNAHIHWSTDVMAYNGTVRSYGAYVTLLGADSTEENGGQFDFVLTLNRTHNGAGVASAANNVDLRDAGTYVATIDLNYNNLPSAIKALYTAEAYADLKANYTIAAYTHTYTISRVSANVTWSIGSYTYNGTDQSGDVSASITLLGTDVTTYGSTDYLTIAFNRNSVASTFQNAGAYELIASFTVDALANNYILTGYTNNATINKANVVNIAFAGTDGWTYYAGETYYYFVVAAGSNPTYAKTSALDFTPASFVHRDALGNLIDNDPIVITYSAGEYSHANASGNNGVKNAGSYTITATVDTTDNFNQWSGSITVTIAQGWINDYEHNDHGIVNNIVMYGYSTTYDGNQHRVFAFNGTLGNTPRSEFVQVLNPDGSVATVTYNIDINAYENEDYDPLSPLFDPDSNYAVDAGTYAVGAVIAATGNYHQCVIQNVFLIINPLARNITWLYADNYVANFRYNATDQASRVTAQIQRVDGGVTTDFYLSVAFQLDRQSLFDTIDNDTFAALEHVFVIAGDYTVTASIPVGAADYEQIVNNYTLNTPYVDITMNQFVVSINWYYDCDHVVGTPEEYDEPCEYDKTTHGVSAKGYGVGGVEMDIVTSGTFSAVNAGDYVASVSSIVAGTDTIASVLVNGQPCQLPYTFNYTLDNTVLNWAIARREVNIVTGATLISKIYDGSAIFSLGSYSVNEPGNNPPTVVSKTWTYTTSNASAYNSQIIYTMTNIISGDFNDMTLLIATVEADKANVNASSATVTFNNAELNSNYVIVGANANGMFVENPENPSTHEPYEMITPLEIDLVFDADQSHVYNGQTFAASYNAGDAITSAVSGLFTLRTTTGGNSISYLIAGNVLIGSYNIGGAVNAGNNYTLTGSFHTEDSESAENYIVSVVDATYTIEQRYMKVDYTNLLQSINTAKSDVGGTFNLAESDDTDLVWFGNTISLATLTSSLTITITNTGWKSDIASKTSYTRYVGAATAGSNLRVVLSSNNYYIDYPVLQVTYMTNGGSYSGFTVDDLNDLMHLDSDSYGLYLARTDPNDPVGVLPTFTQTADISGLLTSGAYTALPTIRPFHANYVGNNHSISNIIVVNNSDMEQSDSKYFGFFSKIEEGVVENIHLYDVYLYSTTPKTAIGGLAGEISGLTTEVNGIILNVTIIANADDNDREEDVYIGGMVGLLTDGSIDEATVLGYVRINGVSADNIYYGGVIGYAEAGAASDLLSFVDSSVFANGITYYCGGIIGDNGVSFELSDYSYLKSALYVKESNNSHILRDSAFGNAVNPSASVSKDYNDMYTALNAASVPGTLLDAYDIVETYMIRTYLFATGCTGTTSNKVVITNYRQIALLLAYPYLNFSVNADIFSPIDLNQYDRGFSGSITYVGGATIKAYNVHSTINLFAVARDTNVVVSLSPRREL